MYRVMFISVGLVGSLCCVGCERGNNPGAAKPTFQGVALSEFSQPTSPSSTTPESTPASSNQPGSGMSSARGNTNFQAGAGAIQNIRKAGQRALTLADMQQLGQFMTMMQLETNQMPKPAAVKEFIRRDAPKLVSLIEDGTIVLTGTSDRSGLWAYEIDADKLGGIGLLAGTPQRMSQEEIQRWLRR
jgi:hypothetical protein